MWPFVVFYWFSVRVFVYMYSVGFLLVFRFVCFVFSVCVDSCCLICFVCIACFTCFQVLLFVVVVAHCVSMFSKILFVRPWLSVVARGFLIVVRICSRFVVICFILFVLFFIYCCMFHVFHMFYIFHMSRGSSHPKRKVTPDNVRWLRAVGGRNLGFLRIFKCEVGFGDRGGQHQLTLSLINSRLGCPNHKQYGTHIKYPNHEAMTKHNWNHIRETKKTNDNMKQLKTQRKQIRETT